MWAVIQYNNDDNYDAETVGIYSTEKLAIQKILKICKREFREYENEKDDFAALDEDDRFYEHIKANTLDWRCCKKILKKELRSSADGSGECVGLSYLNYKYAHYVIDA